MSKQRLPGQLSGQSGGHRTFFLLKLYGKLVDISVYVAGLFNQKTGTRYYIYLYLHSFPYLI